MNLSELAQIEFRVQLDAMQLNLRGCLTGEDPIHLHDLRVANRRFRAALVESKNLLPLDSYRHFQEDLKWLHRSSNPVRNLDVAGAHFPLYRKKVSKSWRDYLSPAFQILDEKRRQAQLVLNEALQSDRISAFFESVTELLEAEGLKEGQLAVESAREYGSKRIIKRYGKLRRGGLEISKRSPVEEYHSFRIRAKKLRYQIEFYQPVFDPEAVSDLRIGLKGLQDALGALQDTVVELGIVKDLAEDLQEQEAELEELLALGQLIGRMEKTIKTSRKNSLQQIRWLVSDPVSRKFQSTFQYLIN